MRREIESTTKQKQAAETAVVELRRSVQQEQKKTATLTQEAKAAQAEMRREIESTTKQKQAAETAVVELRRSVQQEQKKTATLTQEAKAAQAETRREIESKTAQSQKAVDGKPCRRPPPNCEKPCSRSNRRLPP